MNVRQLKKELQVYPPDTEVKIIAIGNKAGLKLNDGMFAGTVIIVDQDYKNDGLFAGRDYKAES